MNPRVENSKRLTRDEYSNAAGPLGFDTTHEAWLALCARFGDKSSNVYKVLFLIMTFLGSVLTSTNILDMSDLMILGMAFPNILGLYILSGDVRKDLDSYWASHKAGEFKEHKS